MAGRNKFYFPVIGFPILLNQRILLVQTLRDKHNFYFILNNSIQTYLYSLKNKIFINTGFVIYNEKAYTN